MRKKFAFDLLCHILYNPIRNNKPTSQSLSINHSFHPFQVERRLDRSRALIDPIFLTDGVLFLEMKEVFQR